jgi:hypothetical protein
MKGDDRFEKRRDLIRCEGACFSARLPLRVSVSYGGRRGDLPCVLCASLPLLRGDPPVARRF